MSKLTSALLATVQHSVSTNRLLCSYLELPYIWDRDSLVAPTLLHNEIPICSEVKSALRSRGTENILQKGKRLIADAIKWHEHVVLMIPNSFALRKSVLLVDDQDSLL